MRSQLSRLEKGKSTKAERRVGEILKRNKIKFLTKWKIGKYEADFIIRRLVVEVDGGVHKATDSKKDTYFASKGFVPIHISNATVKDMEQLEKELLILIKQNNE